MLTVAGNRYTTRFVPAASKAPAQLRLLIDGPHRGSGRSGRDLAADRLGFTVPRELVGGCRVVANVFDGGPRTRVTLEVPGAGNSCSGLAMAPAAMPDPLMAELFQGDTPRKSWVAATTCAHLWQTSLPANLAPGAHILQVRAIDEYGREHLARTVLEVTA
jgi:hypothetical protein